MFRINRGDVQSYYCTLNEEVEVVDRNRFKAAPKVVEKWLIDVPPTQVAMKTGMHSIWLSK